MMLRNYCRTIVGAAVLLTCVTLGLPAGAAIHRVPENHTTIQAAVDAAEAGDTVLVRPGTYKEHVQLKSGITLKSAGDDAPGKLGLKRAETTIIDGSQDGKSPGVSMAEGSILDGFTVTNTGKYDEAEWKKHHATQGNNQPHEHIGKPGIAGVSVVGVTCTVKHNIVHHIGYSGIAIRGEKGKRCSPTIFHNVCYRNMGGGIGSMNGSTAIIEENVCFQNFYAGIGHDAASPLVLNNTCYENIRAGIGVSEGACPVVRGNKCFKNRRAGIGVRTGEATSPVIENNDCYENDMAGIGSEEKATPIIRNNRCYKNKMAGIGCQDHAAPLIVSNKCFENDMAGIGSRDGARPLIKGNLCQRNKLAGIGVRNKAVATILSNKCLENGTVAIGVRDGATAQIFGNELVRTGGMPPMIAVREGSEAEIGKNIIRGGGVAGVLVQGTAQISNNRFEGNGPRRGGPPNFAVWVQEGSDVRITGNEIDRWRHGIFASAAKRVNATANTVSGFLSIAIVIRKTTEPATVVGNTALSSNAADKPVDVQGPAGVVANNERKAPPKNKNATPNKSSDSR